MSHSRIFQYSKGPISEDSYIDNEFMTNDFIWHKFESRFCGDYTDTRRKNERLDDIKWLEMSLSRLNIRLDGEDKFVLEKGSHQAIKDLWYDRIKKAFDELDKENIANYLGRWNLRYAVTDPLSLGFGFLFYSVEEEDLTAGDDFFEFLLGLNEGDSFYIGATLDYHC